MNPDPREVARRERTARKYIAEALAQGDDTDSVKLFVDHHLEQIPAAEWTRILGEPLPSAQRVVESLVLRGHWSEADYDAFLGDGGEAEEGEAGIDIFDFTLPGDVTQYVLAVHFGPHGEVEHLTMDG